MRYHEDARAAQEMRMFLQDAPPPPHMSYDVSSLDKLLQGVFIRGYIGDYYRVIKGDTRSLDHGSYTP